MAATLDVAAVAALADERLSWRFKGLPADWQGRTVADVRAERPRLFEAGATGPVCVLQADALRHNLDTMARWCAQRGVQLAPHGKTHMAPQLYAEQLAAGAWAVTAATIHQVRMYRAFGASPVILANELVDRAGLRWLAAEMAADPGFRPICWVDSEKGVELMGGALDGAARPLDVCVEVGEPGARTGCRTDADVDAVATAAAASPQLRLIGVAGYEAALGHDVTAANRDRVRAYLSRMRAAALRLRAVFETDEILVTAGGSTHFDLVADVLAEGWPAGMTVRTVVRSGAYLTHDDGLYARTSPVAFRPALSVWAQVCSRPEPDLALLTMGRRDVSFDQDLPVPRGLPHSKVTKLNDQHAFLRLGRREAPRVDVGDWIEFGISHPCTVFDKWQLIPVLDADGRVVDLIRTFF